MTIMAPLWFAIMSAVVLMGLPLWRSAGGKSRGALELLAAALLWALLCDLRFDDDRQQVRLVTPGAGPTPAWSGPRMSWRGDGSGDVISPRQIALRHGAGAPLEVHGHGLPAAAWREGLGGILRFRPPPLPEGFIAAQWSSHLDRGQALRVQGQVSGPVDAVELRMNDQLLDRIPTTSEGHFEVQTIPPVAGRYELELVALAGGQLFARERVASEVRDFAAPVVHVDLSRPSFESRALKNWLQSAGVAGRFQVSLAPGIERREPLAAPGRSADLWITDTTHLDELPAPQRERRLAQVEAGEMNLLILADPGDVPHLGSWFATAPASNPEVSITVADQRLQASRVLAFAPETQPLLDQAATVTAVREYGGGQIGALAIADSYRWLGEGHEEPYARFWSRLLSALLPTQAAPLWLEHSEHQATVGLRSTVCVSGPEIPDVQPTPIIPLLTRMRASDYSCHDWWPHRAGWNQIGQYQVYVYTNEQWSALRAADRQNATAAAATISSPDNSHTAPLMDRRLLWLILFLAAVLPLWALGPGRSHA